MMTAQRRLAVLLAAAVLACAASAATARLMVVQQDVSSDVPGVAGRTYYVLSSQPEQAASGAEDASDNGGALGTEEGGGLLDEERGLSLSAAEQQLPSARSISVLSINPFSWLRLQLEAVEALQRATLLSWLVPLSQEQEESQQVDELRSVAGDADVQEQMLLRLGCSRFHAAVAEYARQANSIEAASSDDSSSSVSFGFLSDGEAQGGQEESEAQLRGSSARLSSDADTVWAFDAQLSMASLDEGSSVSDTPLSDSVEAYRYFGSGDDDDMEEYYTDYELDYTGGQDSADLSRADLSELRAQVRTAMVADSVVRLLVRDAYSAYAEDVVGGNSGDYDYAASREDVRMGVDVDDYGVELTLRNALMAELIESEYFSDEDYDMEDDYSTLLPVADDDGDVLSSDVGLDEAWADYLEDAYEYEYINYSYYDDEEEVGSMSFVSAFGRYYTTADARPSRQDGHELGGASELVAWTQNGELVLALLPRFSAADEEYLPGEGFLQGESMRDDPRLPMVELPLMEQLGAHLYSWLVDRDGVKWGLVTLCLLAGGTLAMLVGFVASWLSLRRTMRRRHVYIPCVLRRTSSGEQCMLAAPLLGSDYGYGCGGKQLDVEYAAEHIDAGSNESVAKALTK